MKIPDKKPQHFCIAPFQSIRQNAYGQNSPCAFGAGEWNHGHLTPKERWHSPELQQLRQDFIDGKKPDACKRCWDEEASGKKSLRERNNDYFPNDYENFIKTDQWLKGPKTAVFKTSNICNLACRSCAGWDSNFYAREGQHYLKEYQTKALHNGELIDHNRFIPLRAPKHLDFDLFKEISDNFTKLDFFGGEPFLNTTHLSLLEDLIAKGQSYKMTLFYSTNGTVIPSEKLTQMWSKFREVQISFSVDGLEKTYEYTRWPAKWDDLLDVIYRIKRLRLELQCKLTLMGSFTISSMNCFEADALAEWHKKKFGNYYINMVQSPDYLAIHTLPEHVKKQIRERVTNPEVRGYLDIYPSHDEKFQEFITWMKRQDLYRQQSFADYYPQYFSLIENDWNRR